MKTRKNVSAQRMVYAHNNLNFLVGRRRSAFYEMKVK